jgi:hypothetical protein
MSRFNAIHQGDYGKLEEVEKICLGARRLNVNEMVKKYVEELVV